MKRSGRAATRSTRSGRSTRSALSTSIRRRPARRELVQAGLDQRALAGAARAGEQHVVGAAGRRRTARCCARRRSFCGSTSFRSRQADRGHMAHRLEHAALPAAAVAKGHRRTPVRRVGRMRQHMLQPRQQAFGADQEFLGLRQQRVQRVRHGAEFRGRTLLRACSSTLAVGPTSGGQALQCRLEVLGGRPLEARARVALQAADRPARSAPRPARCASTVGVVEPAASAAPRRLWRSCDSTRSKNWFMRAISRSCSNTSASPTITRVMPGFFSPNCSSTATIFCACSAPDRLALGDLVDEREHAATR